jgi:hypothetical protein
VDTTAIRYIPRKPDKKGPAYDILVRHEAPVATVIAVIAVITHDEILAFRHDLFDVT